MLMKGGIDWNPHGDVLNICSCKAVVMTSMPINSCSPFDRLEIPSSPHEGMHHSGKSMLPDWIVSFEKSQDKGTCSMKIMHWEGIFEIGLNTYVRPWNCKFSMFDTACELVTCYSLTSVRQLLCQSYKHALCYCLKPYLGCARSQRRGPHEKTTDGRRNDTLEGRSIEIRDRTTRKRFLAGPQQDGH